MPISAETCRCQAAAGTSIRTLAAIAKPTTPVLTAYSVRRDGSHARLPPMTKRTNIFEMNTPMPYPMAAFARRSVPGTASRAAAAKGQGQAEEQGAEGDAGVVEADEAPHPDEQGVAPRAFGSVGDGVTGDLIGLCSHPNSPGNTPSEVVRSSVSGTVKWPCTSTASLPGSTTPMRVMEQAAGFAHRAEAALLGAGHRDEYPAGRFAEEERERTCAVLEVLGNEDPATRFTGQRGLHDGLDQPALTEIVCGGDQSVTRGGREHIGEQLLPFEVDLGGNPPR